MDRRRDPDRSPAGGGPVASRTELGAARGWAAQLERWAADARVDEAARLRARERWLRHQAEEDGSFGGVLVDLADAGGAVQVHLRGGAVVTGAIRAVGADVVAVDPGKPGAGPVVVSIEAVTSVRSGTARRPVTGDRAAPSTLRFDDVLVELAAEREHVRVVTVDGGVVTGCVQAVGRDVVTLTAGDAAAPTGPTYLPRGAVAAVTLDA